MLLECCCLFFFFDFFRVGVFIFVRNNPDEDSEESIEKGVSECPPPFSNIFTNKVQETGPNDLDHKLFDIKVVDQEKIENSVFDNKVFIQEKRDHTVSDNNVIIQEIDNDISAKEESEI